MSAFPFLNDGLPICGKHVREALCYGKHTAAQRKKFIDYLLEQKEYDSMLYCIRFSGADGVPELSPAELEALVSGLLGDKRSVSHALQLLGFDELPEELRKKLFLLVASGGDVYIDILCDSAEEYKLTPEHFALLPA
jgi:hypothetical protein